METSLTISEKNTLMQTTQGNAENKACKRVFFSLTQKEIQLFFPTLRFFNFVATAQPTTENKLDSLLHVLTGQCNLKRTTDARTANSVLPQLAVMCKIDAECYYKTFVQVDSEVLRNRHLRVAAKR